MSVVGETGNFMAGKIFCGILEWEAHVTHLSKPIKCTTRQSKPLGKLQTLVNHQFGCFSIVSSVVTNVPHRYKTVIRGEMEVGRGMLWELWSFCTFFP